MRWDIFCKVIDNYGDIGVAWRLSADLASRGEQVRLWVDDARALRWMAPGGCPGVTVHPWTSPLNVGDLTGIEAGDVLIEAFGCDPDPEFIALFAGKANRAAPQNKSPNRINLEYLTAERYAQRSHALPSPVVHGPGAGLTKHFFYPGFGTGTGGLLRETEFLTRQAAFDRDVWLKQLVAQPLPEAFDATVERPVETTQIGTDDPKSKKNAIGAFGKKPERLISLFCYEPPALSDLLDQLAQAEHANPPTRLLVTAGRASSAVAGLIEHKNLQNAHWNEHDRLAVTYLPALSQNQFDELLWGCNLNFVRGEDSLVRACLAGKPFVWHIYPQADNAHHIKLEAFLDAVQAPAPVRFFHQIWNGLADGPLLDLDPAMWHDWQIWAAQTRTALSQQTSLTERLMEFVAKTR